MPFSVSLARFLAFRVVFVIGQRITRCIGVNRSGNREVDPYSATWFADPLRNFLWSHTLAHCFSPTDERGCKSACGKAPPDNYDSREMVWPFNNILDLSSADGFGIRDEAGLGSSHCLQGQ